MLPHMTEPTPPVPVFDPRAVIEGRVPGRPRVGFIAGIVITAACAIVALSIDAGESFAAGQGVVPFVIALPLALLPVPLLVALVLWVDRLEPEPRGPLIFAFAWGAGIAALAALIINTAGLEYVTQPALGASTGEYVSATFGAPVVEETLKGLVLVGLLWRRRDELDGPTDGVIYAAMVGLGFAMIENVGYYINALVTPQRGGIELLGYTFVLRGLFSPLLHPLFTSMTGLGVAYAASRRHGGGWAVVAGWLAAMLLHGIWNGLSVYGTAGVLIGYAIMSCVLAGVIAVLVADRHRIVGPDQARTARLRGDGPGHQRRHRHAQLAAGAPPGAELGPRPRRHGRGDRHERLPARRHRARPAARQGRPRRHRQPHVHRPPARPARPHAHRQALVRAPFLRQHPPGTAARPLGGAWCLRLRPRPPRFIPNGPVVTPVRSAAARPG